MSPKRNKVSKQDAAQISSQINKKFPISHTTGKERDVLIPTKDKSPDDLEIFE